MGSPNFCETVPINLFLSLILYYFNLFFVVPALIILCVGRTIHARAISDINENLKKRVIGMRLTIFYLYSIDRHSFLYKPVILYRISI